MLFIQERREQVKRDNPDIAVTQQQKVRGDECARVRAHVDGIE